jgi:hypothetical protein
MQLLRAALAQFPFLDITCPPPIGKLVVRHVESPRPARDSALHLLPGPLLTRHPTWAERTAVMSRRSGAVRGGCARTSEPRTRRWKCGWNWHAPPLQPLKISCSIARVHAHVHPHRWLVLGPNVQLTGACSEARGAGGQLGRSTRRRDRPLHQRRANVGKGGQCRYVVCRALSILTRACLALQRVAHSLSAVLYCALCLECFDSAILSVSCPVTARSHSDRAAINSVRVSSTAADQVPKWFYSTKSDRKQIGPVSAAGACPRAASVWPRVRFGGNRSA